jgi:regulatory protein
MKITGIEEQKKNNKRCSIYIDGEYLCSAERDLVEELGLSEGMELSEEEFNRTLERIQYKGALRAALYMLARTSKTEMELEKRLNDKQHPPKAIKQALEYLKELGYINDEEYTEGYIRNTRDTTGTSRRSIYCKLAAKGVDKEIIQQKLDEAEIDDFSSALKAARKKAVGLSGSDIEKKAKLLNFLYRKGFGIEVCRKVIEELDLESAKFM